MKLRSYFLWITVITLLPVILFASAMLFIADREHETSSETSIIQMARALSLTVDREISASIELLNALGVTQELDVGNLKGFYEEALRFLGTRSAWQTIVLAEPSGQQIINLNKPIGVPLPRASAAELIKQVVDTRRPVVSDLFTGAVTSAPTIAVIVPIIRDGAVRYTISASFSHEALTSFLLKQELPTGWLATIIDRKKIIIARNRNLEAYLGKPATPLFAKMSEESAATSWRGTPYDGGSVLAGLHRSELTGWTVGVAAPASSLDTPFNRVVTLSAIGFLFLFLGGGLAVFFSQKITTSVNHLNEAARQVAEGNLETRIGPMESISEIGELSRLFDRMGESLRLRQSQLGITHKLSQAILSGESLESLSQETLQALLSSLSLDFGSIRIVNDDRVSLRVLAAIGFRDPGGISTQTPAGSAIDQSGGFRIINSGKPYIVEDIPNAPGLRTLKKEGGQSGIAVPIVDKNRNILGVLHTVSRSPRKFDESEIKFVESIGAQLGIAIERAQAEEERQQLILAQSHAMPGIARLDTAGRYVSVNRVYAEILGYTPEELLGADWQPTVHPQDRPTALAAYQRMVQEGQGEFEARAVRQDGTHFHKQVLMVKIVDHNGAMIGHHCFMKDISDRKNHEEFLQQSQDQLRSLALRIETVREEERTRIARDIHDNIGQVLTALKLDLFWIKKMLPAADNSLLDKFAAIAAILDETTATVRTIATELRPGVLDDLGLVPAMESQLRDFQNRTGIKYFLQNTAGKPQLGQQVSTALFRCFQESLTNVARHSEATEVRVGVTLTAGKLQIRVSDNGRGIKTEDIDRPNALGLLGMRERLHMVGGELNFDQNERNGTTVTIEAPLLPDASPVQAV